MTYFHGSIIREMTHIHGSEILEMTYNHSNIIRYMTYIHGNKITDSAAGLNGNLFLTTSRTSRFPTGNKMSYYGLSYSSKGVFYINSIQKISIITTDAKLR